MNIDVFHNEHFAIQEFGLMNPVEKMLQHRILGVASVRAPLQNV